MVQSDLLGVVSQTRVVIGVVLPEVLHLDVGCFILEVVMIDAFLPPSSDENVESSNWVLHLSQVSLKRNVTKNLCSITAYSLCL